MEELIEKIENLKKELDKNSKIIEIKKLNKELNNNKDLLNLIALYKKTQDNEIKNKIVNDEFYLKYKHLENEVNFIILNIRSKLKVISISKSGCGLNESN